MTAAATPCARRQERHKKPAALLDDKWIARKFTEPRWNCKSYWSNASKFPRSTGLPHTIHGRLNLGEVGRISTARRAANPSRAPRSSTIARRPSRLSEQLATSTGLFTDKSLNRQMFDRFANGALRYSALLRPLSLPIRNPCGQRPFMISFVNGRKIVVDEAVSRK